MKKFFTIVSLVLLAAAAPVFAATTAPKVVNCRSNFACLIRNAKTCAKATATISARARKDDFGLSSQAITTRYDITARESEDCVVETKIIKDNFRYTAQAIKAMKKQGKNNNDIKLSAEKMSKILAGIQQACKGKPTNVAIVLSNWKKGNFDSDCSIGTDKPSSCTYKPAVVCTTLSSTTSKR